MLIDWGSPWVPAASVIRGAARSARPPGASEARACPPLGAHGRSVGAERRGGPDGVGDTNQSPPGERIKSTNSMQIIHTNDQHWQHKFDSAPATLIEFLGAYAVYELCTKRHFGSSGCNGLAW